MDLQINITHRPWGNYIKFLQEEGVWVKRVEVNPKSRLSLQKHQHRSEKWNVIKGRGLVTVDSQEVSVGPGSIIDVPLGAIHRMANTGDEPLVFIEVACGDNLTEDDIERIEDDYSRDKK